MWGVDPPRGNVPTTAWFGFSFPHSSEAPAGKSKKGNNRDGDNDVEYYQEYLRIVRRIGEYRWVGWIARHSQVAISYKWCEEEIPPAYDAPEDISSLHFESERQR